MANVCLCHCQSTSPAVFCASLWCGAGAWDSITHVDFAILKPLLQIVVDGLVGDFANQREIRDSNFLLLGRLKDGLLCELGLLLPRARGGSIFFAPCALRNCLYTLGVSASRGD
jgi:hypothetical protein